MSCLWIHTMYPEDFDLAVWWEVASIFVLTHLKHNPNTDFSTMLPLDCLEIRPIELPSVIPLFSFSFNTFFDRKVWQILAKIWCEMINRSMCQVLIGIILNFIHGVENGKRAEKISPSQFLYVICRSVFISKMNPTHSNWPRKEF